MPSLRRRIKSVELKYLLTWLLSLCLVVLLMKNNSETNLDTARSCSRSSASNGGGGDIEYIRLRDDVDSPTAESARQHAYPYNRQMPLVFVGGVPRSGTTLMRAMLDAHPAIRCGEETRIIPRLIYMRNQWNNSKKENERLKNAGMTDEIIDSAIGSFILEVIVRHGKPAEVLCLQRWNNIIEHMYAQCMSVGPDSCMPVYYEQLVLHPEATMRRVLDFLNVGWNESVIHHEQFIGKEISLSKVERSSDQVIKPVNLEALSNWVGKIPAETIGEHKKHLKEYNERPLE